LQISDAIENEKEVSKTFQIYNVDRAVCGRVAGVIAKKYGDTGFAGQLNITYVNRFLFFFNSISLMKR
jgi:glutamate synthase (ferredoxin)